MKKKKNTNGNGLVQLIRVGNFIRLKWVNFGRKESTNDKNMQKLTSLQMVNKGKFQIQVVELKKSGVKEKYYLILAEAQVRMRESDLEFRFRHGSHM